MTKEKKAGPAIKVKDHTILAAELKSELVSDRKLELTVKRAEEFLEMDTFQGERPPADRHVQFLYDQYAVGRFMWEQVCIGIGECEGKRYRLNGQHTCWMRLNVKENISPQVREMVYRVKDMESLRALYCTFDRNKPRTNSHSLKALLVGTSLTSTIRASAIGNLASGLKFWRFPDTRSSRAMTPDDVAVLCSEQYPELFKAVGALYQELAEDYHPLKRNSVVAAMFATMEAKPDLARDFWGPVGTGLGLTEKTDARHQLRRYLDTHVRASGHGNADDAIATGPEEMYRVCIGAWNRWRRKESVQVLKTSDQRVKPI